MRAVGWGLLAACLSASTHHADDEVCQLGAAVQQGLDSQRHLPSQLLPSQQLADAGHCGCVLLAAIGVPPLCLALGLSLLPLSVPESGSHRLGW